MVTEILRMACLFFNMLIESVDQKNSIGPKSNHLKCCHHLSHTLTETYCHTKNFLLIFQIKIFAISCLRERRIICNQMLQCRYFLPNV